MIQCEVYNDQEAYENLRARRLRVESLEMMASDVRPGDEEPGVGMASWSRPTG